MNRWPTILIVLVGLVGLVFLERSSTDSDAATAVAELAPRTERAIGDPQGSTWYCPGGFTTPDGANDHRVIVTNPTEEIVSGSLTIFPSLLDVVGDPVAFERAVQRLELAPNSQQVISLAPIVASLDPLLATNTGSFVGALVEFGRSGVSVEHATVSPAGTDMAACSTTASSSWWFASGTTTNAVTHQIYLLNPFPDAAVVDVSFVTDAGVRTPSRLDGRLIPAQSVTMLDITDVVPVWDQVTAQVTTRTGRVIAERLQIFGDEAGPIGLSLTPGTNALSEQWFFPAGGSVGGAGESYVIYNPNDLAAEVEFELKPDSADRAGDQAPLRFRVGPNERWVVNVSVHPGHPSETLASLEAPGVAEPGEGYFVSVRSFNGVGVVAERVMTRPLDLARGVTASLGIIAGSTEQMMAIPNWAVADVPGTLDGELAVFNPAGDTISRVEVWVGDEEGQLTLRNQIELAPRRRAAFDLAPMLDAGDQWIRVLASRPTMAEMVAVAPNAVLHTSAVPAAGSLVVPDLLEFD